MNGIPDVNPNSRGSDRIYSGRDQAERQILPVRHFVDPRGQHLDPLYLKSDLQPVPF